MNPPVDCPLTLGIVTYRRPQLFANCLDSLVQQKLKPKRVIVVDNDPQKSAFTLIDHHHYPFQIDYYYHSKSTPLARNLVLDKCTTPWLGFIDDDCLVDSHWFAHALTLIKTATKNTGYLVGTSKLANSHSLAARAQYQLYQSWFKSLIVNDQNLLQPDSLDTKNCLLNMLAVRNNHLKFDARFITPTTSGLEDTDFGRQLYQCGFVGFHSPSLVIHHHEKTLSEGLLSKAYHRGRLRYWYDRKWQLTDPWLESSVNLKIWHKFHPNMEKLKLRYRWLKHNWASRHPFSAKIELLIQEAYLLSFNQGYLDERARDQIAPS